MAPGDHGTQVLPAPMHDVLTERGKPFFQTVARLKPAISRTRAEASLQPLATALRQQYPDANAGHAVSVQPITTALYSSTGGERGLQFVSIVLLVLVGLVLLIACSNVANLLMARAVKRRQEIALRLAIGASRGRLLRQLLTESVLLSVLGGMVGLVVGYEGCQLLWSFRRLTSFAISSGRSWTAPYSSLPCYCRSPPVSSSAWCLRCVLHGQAWSIA